MRRTHVVIRGDVHNVGFRAWTKHKADFFGVKGWVKNNVNGTVEALFEGEDYRVEEMVQSCNRGPPTSYVEKVEVKEEMFRGDMKNFRIVS